MKFNKQGFEESRFENIPDEFCCPICCLIVNIPWDCSNCSSIFCEKCV